MPTPHTPSFARPRNLGRLAALLLIAALAGCPAPAPAVDPGTVQNDGGGQRFGATIRGKVVFDGIDYSLAQTPGVIDGAEVYLEGLPNFRTKSDAEGRFELIGVPVGEHHVIAEKQVESTLMKVRNRVDLSAPEQTTDLASMVLRQTGSVIGTVALEGKREDLLGADIFIAGTTNIAKAKDDGAFAFANLAAGTYKLTAAFPGYAPLTQTVEVRAGKTSDLSFDLKPAKLSELPLRAAGTVTGADGQPLSGAAVSLTGPVSLSVISDDQGQFSLANVLAGSYTVVVFHPDHALKRENREVAPPNSVEEAKALVNLGSIALSALGEPETPPPAEVIAEVIAAQTPSSVAESPRPNTAEAEPNETQKTDSEALPPVENTAEETEIRARPTATPVPSTTPIRVIQPIATPSPTPTPLVRATLAPIATILPADFEIITPRATYKAHSGTVFSVAARGNADVVYSAGAAGEVFQWTSGRLTQRYDGHRETSLAFCVDVSADGRYVATGGNGGTSAYPGKITVHPVGDPRNDVTLGQAIGSQERWQVNGVAFHPSDSELLASASGQGSGGSVKIWNARSGAVQTTLRGHEAAATDVAFSPNGRFLVSSSDDRTAIVWNWQDGSILWQLSGHRDVVTGVAVRQDSQQIATCSADGSIKRWDVNSGNLIDTLNRPHDAAVLAVTFHPTENLLASAGRDGRVIIWDEKGTAVARFKHPTTVHDVAFDPSGRLLYSVSADGLVRAWEVPSYR
ncbi:MAG: carboxypeptidase regulatory-like domain-containing protein [Candidatus Sericytochromatia bacterium]|nr:carboxypeptidase regulatory-like domain-containing protein [Candidatus Sericytochromatia bacterium]